MSYWRESGLAAGGMVLLCLTRHTLPPAPFLLCFYQVGVAVDGKSAEDLKRRVLTLIEALYELLLMPKVRPSRLHEPEGAGCQRIVRDRTRFQCGECGPLRNWSASGWEWVSRLLLEPMIQIGLAAAACCD